MIRTFVVSTAIEMYWSRRRKIESTLSSFVSMAVAYRSTRSKCDLFCVNFRLNKPCGWEINIDWIFTFSLLLVLPFNLHSVLCPTIHFHMWRFTSDETKNRASILKLSHTMSHLNSIRDLHLFETTEKKNQSSNGVRSKILTISEYI